MVQQTVESKFSEYGLSNTETNLSTSDKQFPVAVKKTALRDVQNENRIPNKIENSPKDKVSMDAMKAAGIKRSLPKDPVSPLPYHHSPNSNAANAQLVYVRRKFETETSKSSICDVRSINAVFLDSGQHDHAEETSQLKTQIKEPKVSCFSAFSPMPIASLTTASGKPSVPFPVNSNTRFSPTEPNVASTPLANNMKGVKNLHWEERYHQLHVLLKKFDETDQEDYLQMLRSLSSVELSRHAVDLEKRSIQLSLEEAKEMQRVGALNILGKLKNGKTSTSCQADPEKQ